MKIRNRLSIVFSVTTACVLLALSLILYFFSRNFHRDEFFMQLEDRLQRTEAFFLEASGLPPPMTKQIREAFLQKLPEEREWALDPSLPLPDGLEPLLRKEIVAGNEGTIRFDQGQRQGVARIYLHGDRQHLVVVTAIDRFGLSKLYNLRSILLIAFPIGLALAALIGRLATRKALLPLETNISQARRIGAGNLGARLALPQQEDEIHDFVTIFNELLGRLEQAFTFQQTFISNASHEIRNPLTVIAGEAEIALSAERSPQAYRDSLEVIAKEADRMNVLVNNLLSLARTGGESLHPNLEEFALPRLLQDVRHVITHAWPEQSLQWPNPGQSRLRKTILCDPLMLRSALVNVLDNACKYGQGRPVSLEIQTEPGRTRFIIRDEGIGIPADAMPLVLVPLYRAHNARSFFGQGIGLPLVDRIVRMHNGRLEISSDPGKGTIVSIELRDDGPNS